MYNRHGSLVTGFGDEGLIKICGLRTTDAVDAAITAGADLLGFIFAPSRRRVTAHEVVGAIGDSATLPSGRPRLVGVFVDASVDEMNSAAEAASLDVIQLHGREAPDIVGALNRPVIRACSPHPGATAEDVARMLDPWFSSPVPAVLAIVDGYSAGFAGGTGRRADWSLARSLTGRFPIMLAGGLDPGNVSEAIATVKPRGVDVSSGVERDGAKDRALIARFVDEGRRAFQRTSLSSE